MTIKIIGLQIENLRKIKTAEMQFTDKGLIQFRGENGQGKTTVLDAITMLFLGDKEKMPDMVRHGEEKGKITLDLGNYKVEKVFDNEKSRLVITDKNSKQPVKNPQTFLSEMVNQISFNPFKFLNLTPLEKNRFLMKLYKIDFTEINKKLEFLENERKLTGRDIDRFGTPEPVNPAEKVSMTELFEEKKAIEAENSRLRKEYNDSIEAEKLKEYNYQLLLKKYNNDKFELAQEVSDLEAKKKKNLEEIKRLQAENMTITMRVVEIEEEAEKLVAPEMPIKIEIVEPQYKSTTALDEKLNNAEKININAFAYEQYMQKRKAKTELEDKYKSFDDQINDLRNEKLKILSETPTGIDGLVITEDSVFLNNIHSENWSDAQGIEIASRLCIVQNPKLRAIFIDKGESFDRKRLEALESWAIQNDIQAFITIVDEIPENLEDGVFYIEEGNIITKNKGE